MVKSSNGRLRFAALIRVSTERQERQGESLRTQKSQITKAATNLGRIVAWYGGQEHATPGHEKTEVDRLIRDAQKGMFDAVMVAHEDRWSRDNVKSSQGLDTFQARGIQFFVGNRECDLNDPNTRFILAQHAVIGEYHAANQAKKSIENRIERSKRGIPTSGKKPFGRTFNKQTGTWELIPNQVAMIKEIAKRYLAGERMQPLCKEYGVNQSNVMKVLRERCGTKWTETFNYPKFGIQAKVEHCVPRLLPEKTVAAIRKKAAKNKKFSRGSEDRYLLSQFVFCGCCRYTMTGGSNRRRDSRLAAKRYYQHVRPSRERVRPCPINKSWVGAKDLEDRVIMDLFNMFGNPKAVERAVQRAIPNQDEVVQLQKQQASLQRDLAKTAKQTQAIIKAIRYGTFTQDEAKAEMEDLRQQKAAQTDQLNEVVAKLSHLPSKASVKTLSEGVVSQLRAMLYPARRATRKLPTMVYEVTTNGKTTKRFDGTLELSLGMLDSQDAIDAVESMSWEDKRSLVELVFSGNTLDGKPAGVYIDWPDKNSRRWTYRIHGLLKPGIIVKTKAKRGGTVNASH